MVTFKRGKLKKQNSNGTTEEVNAVLGSNGLGYTKEGTGRNQRFLIQHTSSGRYFPNVSFTDKVDAERYINDVSPLADWSAKQPNLSHDQQHELRRIYVKVRPDARTSAEKEEDERARRKEEAHKQDQARREKQDYGHHDYRGSGYTKKGRLVKYDRLNKYDINAQNRKKEKIAHAEATGSKAMHQARKRIYTDKRTWLKFQTYNKTRGKYLKG